jgi:histidinol phosphatase-like PHP family hydrolase
MPLGCWLSLVKTLSRRSTWHTTIIHHLTGRQRQRRLGYEIDVEKVLRSCGKNDVAVEINAHPRRPELNWRWHRVPSIAGVS